MTLDHHKPFALEAIHPSPLENDWLSNPIHDQGNTAGQKSSAEDRRTKRQISALGMRPVKKVSDAALYHQHRESEQRSDRKPPRKGSHEYPHRRPSGGLEPAPDGHSSRGSESCQADSGFVRPSVCLSISHAPHRASEAETRRDFKPRCKKIDTDPFPLSAVTRPGSSASFVVTRKTATAKGPAFVR